MKDLTQKSKFLSYVLRHKPLSAGLTLDREGWASVELLLKNSDISLEELVEIVRTDSKQRYSLRPDTVEGVTPPSVTGLMIRANQGHSSPSVRLLFEKAVPPPVLYHGTNIDAWVAIKRQGLKPMNRHHVHLTDDLDTAYSVGGRRRKDVYVLHIDARAMLADGINFFLSDNGVWLVDHVDPKYIHPDQT